MIDAEPLVRLERVRLGYGRHEVLRDVDLSIARRDFVGLTGPNGSGKTTLFRALLGLIEPIDGRLRRPRLRMGYVPQREQLDPLFPLAVREVVALGSPRRPSARAVRAALAAVDLEPLAGRLFADLSGGQRQRVLLARALMVEPELLVLDEPTSGVDDASRAVIEKLLGARNAAGATVLLVSHDRASLERCARRLWHVQGGTVREGVRVA